jgi:hypothetical protein
MAGRLSSWVVITVAAAHYLWRNLVLASAFIDAAHSDFAHYYLAARQIVSRASPFAIHNFDYPPLMAIVVLPLTPLSYLEARWAWFGLSHLCLAAAGVMLWRRMGGGAGAAAVVAVVWSLCGTVAENLVLGQVNPVLLLLVAVAMVAHRWVPATAVAVAAGLKLWPGVLLAGAAVRRQGRLLLLGLALSGVVIVGPLLAFRVLLPAPHLPQSAGFWRGTPAVLNFSLPATVLRLTELSGGDVEPPASWLSGNDPRTLRLNGVQAALSVGTALLTLGAGLTLVFRRSRAGRIDPVPLLASLVAVALVASPVAWYHYRLLHLPGVAWLSWRLCQHRQLLALAYLAVIASGITWAHVLESFVACPPALIVLRGAVVVVFEVLLLALYLGELSPSHEA